MDRYTILNRFKLTSKIGVNLAQCYFLRCWKLLDGALVLSLNAEARDNITTREYLG